MSVPQQTTTIEHTSPGLMSTIQNSSQQLDFDYRQSTKKMQNLSRYYTPISKQFIVENRSGNQLLNTTLQSINLTSQVGLQEVNSSPQPLDEIGRTITPQLVENNRQLRIRNGQLEEKPSKSLLYESVKDSIGRKKRNLSIITPFKRRVANLNNVTNTKLQANVRESQQSLIATTAITTSEKGANFSFPQTDTITKGQSSTGSNFYASAK